MAEEEKRLNATVLTEREESLWLLTFGPLIWSAHFILSYVTAAVWCAKVVERTDGLGGARIAIGVYTGLALPGIGLVAWRGWSRFLAKRPPPYDENTALDRQHFLGAATVLLCGLSFVATVYVALSAVFIGSCL